MTFSWNKLTIILLLAAFIAEDVSKNFWHIKWIWSQNAYHKLFQLVFLSNLGRKNEGTFFCFEYYYKKTEQDLMLLIYEHCTKLFGIL